MAALPSGVVSATTRTAAWYDSRKSLMRENVVLGAGLVVRYLEQPGGVLDHGQEVLGELELIVEPQQERVLRPGLVGHDAQPGGSACRRHPGTWC